MIEDATLINLALKNQENMSCILGDVRERVASIEASLTANHSIASNVREDLIAYHDTHADDHKEIGRCTAQLTTWLKGMTIGYAILAAAVALVEVFVR